MKTRSRNSAHERGAALLVAIGILALLLVISVSFFRMATQEMQVATNYANSIQGELLVDGAIAIAIDTLQQDAIDHPGYTSNDHAWRSRFNGSWAVGKYWTYPYDNLDFIHAIYENSTHYPPLVDLDRLNFALQQYGAANKPELDIDLLHRYMYIPRITQYRDSSSVPAFTPELPGYINPNTGEVDLGRYLAVDGNSEEYFPFTFTTENGQSNLTAHPLNGTFTHGNGLGYVLAAADPNDPTDWTGALYFDSTYPLLPEQQVHFFADVDNDGDGLNDSMWFPAAADTLYPNDGIDNDLDGYIDEFDLDGEPGVFFYSRGYDQSSDFDNTDDREVFLTMPLHRMFMFRTGPDQPWQPIPGITIDDLNYQPIAVNLDDGNPKYQFDTTSHSYDVIDDLPTDYDNILEGDNKDNDFNQIIDDGADASHYLLNRTTRLFYGNSISSTAVDFRNHYHYTSLWTAIFDVWNPLDTNSTVEIRILGESDSEITARIGIYITDEASKVNINEAGGLTYTGDQATSFPMTRSTLTGLSPHQYELRSLNGIGPAIGDRLWTRRMGGMISDPDNTVSFKNGSALATEFYSGVFDPNAAGFNNFGGFPYDMSFPGYGFVDDNGSALWMATNGIDDDGDANWYQHDGIDNDLNGLTDEDGEGILVGVDEGLRPWNYDNDESTLEYATLEGIDEPGEYQHYRPYRNFVAEDPSNVPGTPAFGVTGVSNSDDDSDGVPDEIGELGDRPYRTTEQVKLDDSVFQSTFEDDLDPFITAHSSDDNLSRNYRAGNGFDAASTRTPSGVKLDINFASPEEIARSLKQNFNYDASVPAIVDGWGNNDLNTDGIDNDGDGFIDAFDLDGDGTTALMRAFASGLRQEDTTVVSATEILGLGFGALNQQGSGFEQVIFPSDPELRAHQIAVSAKDFADANFSRSTLTLTADDKWLNFLQTNDPDIGGNTLTYTQAGVEAIRINEIMVRPVRRVEAEATTITTDPRYIAEYDPNYFGADDFRVRPRTMLDELRTRGNVTLEPDPGNGDYWSIQEGPPAFSNLPVMGLRTAWATYQTYLGFLYDDNPADQIPAIRIDVPNLLEFRFQASEQLPAGRYYLTMNSQVVSHRASIPDNVAVHDIVDSVFNSQDFIYYTRRGNANQSILDTVTNQVIDVALGNPLLPGEVDILTTVQSPAALGRNGMSFMQSHEIYNGFTVEVPEAGDGFLYVAIGRNRPDPEPGTLNTTTPLAVNFFDFSQEPDHEYVELKNVSDDVIDLSGFKLAVEGDNGIEMTIPNDTFIAPGGYLLLGSNKFDYLRPISRALNKASANYEPAFNDPGFVGPTLNTIYANGMGLARGTVPNASPIFSIISVDTFDWFEDVTVPPIFDSANNSDRSVFDRTGNNFDFVDDQGDGDFDDPTIGFSRSPGNPEPGISGVITFDDNVVNTVDFSRYPGHSLGLTATNEPWDRIVQLEIPVLEQLDSIGEIGRFVLNGGLFPNYPEQDGIDNDGDNARLVFDNYDNDGDGTIDEVGEGFDEGGLRLHPGNINIESIYIGGYQVNPIFLTMRFGIAGTPFTPLMPVAEPQGGPATPPLDPPAWKKLIEERMWPGDNVIVSLYEGSRYGASLLGRGAEDHVVDRITYTELDVIDRAKDDIINMPDTFIPTQRNDQLRSLWAPNTMGIDFYKSLERKHPFYNGDKHGTTNRNEATDGNYDDWADATSYYVREIEMNEQNLFNFDARTNQTIDKFRTVHDGYSELFQHTLFGSPLRMNMPQRIAENPNFVRELQTVFSGTDEGQFDYKINDLTEVHVVQNGVSLDRQLVYPQVAHRNQPLVSPGDLMTMPHYDRIEQIRAVSDTGFAVDFSAPNQRIVYRNSGATNALAGPMYTDTTVRQIMLGHTFGDLNWDELLGVSPFFNVDYRIRDNAEVLISNGNTLTRTSLVGEPTDADGSNDLSNDLTQLIANTAASDSLSLSVATADVVPFDIENDGFNFTWNLSNPGVVMDWSAAHLFLIGSENSNDGNFIFTNSLSTFNNVIPPTVDFNRWPLERRAITYGSRNEVGFVTGKEALFIWDGNDGIENGEYDIYIGVNEDLRPVMESHQDNFENTGDRVLSTFGFDFVDTVLRTDGNQMRMNINVFTDRDGDGRVWSTTGVTPTASNELNIAASAVGINEAFGAIFNATPDRNGFINYGSVTVENNYLAVYLENTADPSVLNRITRVVLAPRAKTPGRININSVETQYIADEDRYFNPLIGLPGIQFGYDEFDNIFGLDIINNPAVTVNPTQVDNTPFFYKYFPSPPSPPFSLTTDDRGTSSQTDPFIHLRARKIIERRATMQNIHPDGRYYESITDLIQPVLAADDDGVQRLEYPTILSELTRDTSNTPVGNEEAPRFQEIQNRFSRLANMITTRSDVFKIYVTVQTGYVDDLNGDGILNYRDDNEFTVTSEQKATTIYER